MRNNTKTPVLWRKNECLFVAKTKQLGRYAKKTTAALETQV